MRAGIREIFSSIQGEGIYVGVRQIFLRFIGCNLACAYCDTAESLTGHEDMLRVEMEPGTGRFTFFPNPLSAEDLLHIVKKLHPAIHHSLSLTGGEPLLQEKFLREFLPRFQGLCPVFLETNGTLPDALKGVLPYVDIISMDLKQPSATGRKLWPEHEAFLRMAREKDVYVKTVLTGETTWEELDRVREIIEKVDRNIPLVLQPVTPVGGVKPIPGEKLIGVQDYCSAALKNVRVIPQTHKIINQL